MPHSVSSYSDAASFTSAKTQTSETIDPIIPFVGSIGLGAIGAASLIKIAGVSLGAATGVGVLIFVAIIVVGKVIDEEAQQQGVPHRKLWDNDTETRQAEWDTWYWEEKFGDKHTATSQAEWDAWAEYELWNVTTGSDEYDLLSPELQKIIDVDDIKKSLKK